MSKRVKDGLFYSAGVNGKWWANKVMSNSQTLDWWKCFFWMNFGNPNMRLRPNLRLSCCLGVALFRSLAEALIALSATGRQTISACWKHAEVCWAIGGHFKIFQDPRHWQWKLQVKHRSFDFEMSSWSCESWWTRVIFVANSCFRLRAPTKPEILEASDDHPQISP